MTITPDDADGFVVGVDIPGPRPSTPRPSRPPRRRPPTRRSRSSTASRWSTRASPGRAVDWTATEAAIEPGLRGNHTAPIGYVLAEPALTTDRRRRSASRRSSASSPPAASPRRPARTSGWSPRRSTARSCKPGATFGLNEFTGTRGTGRGLRPGRDHPGGRAGHRGRRRDQPVRHHPVQRRVLRRDGRRHPHPALVLHQPLPAGPGGDGVRRRDRAGLLQRLPDRRADRDHLDRRATSRSGSGAPSMSRSSR